MIDRIDQFHARAEECRQLAGMTPKANDQAFWLRLAEEWLRLAEVVAEGRSPAALDDGSSF
jgi:hypothetical protein